MTHSERIDEKFLERLRSLNLSTKTQRNPYLVLHMTGKGIKGLEAFNVQVYTGKKGLTLVTTDKDTLDRLLAGEGPIDEDGKRIILIDDAGWGFPIGGVLCGAYDFHTNQFYVREVEVEYFQGINFHTKSYLYRFSERANEIIDQIGPDLEDTLIKICSGYINEEAKEALRKRGFLVAVAKIGEPLQSWLEEQARKYIIRLVNRDLYYDPKELPGWEVDTRFKGIVEFAEKNKLMRLVKTEWEYFQERNPPPKI